MPLPATPAVRMNNVASVRDVIRIDNFEFIRKAPMVRNVVTTELHCRISSTARRFNCSDTFRSTPAYQVRTTREGVKAAMIHECSEIASAGSRDTNIDPQFAHGRLCGDVARFQIPSLSMFVAVTSVTELLTIARPGKRLSGSYDLPAKAISEHS